MALGVNDAKKLIIDNKKLRIARYFKVLGNIFSRISSRSFRNGIESSVVGIKNIAASTRNAIDKLTNGSELHWTRFFGSQILAANHNIVPKAKYMIKISRKISNLFISFFVSGLFDMPEDSVVLFSDI